jgi:tetratricopeptide (TPR) repeat protein
VAESGGIEGLLGPNLDGPEAGASVAGSEMLAAAIAVGEAGADPAMKRDASAFLRAQQQLIELQVKHFEEERRLAIAAAKRKRLSDRLRNGLQLFLALVLTGAVVGLGVLIWESAHDDGLVVEAFEVPEDLAQRGLTGKVIARQVLDRLSAMQEQTLSMRAPSSYRNNWGDDFKVAIPETGVSLGELRRYLAAWLGHQSRISGEIYRSAVGLSVTARVGESPGVVVSGADAELDRLVQKVTEVVYDHTQPYRYAVYIDRNGATPEGNATVVRILGGADPVERAWAHVHVGVQALARGDYVTSGARLRDALAEEQDFVPALWNLEYVEGSLGHYQEAWRLTGVCLAAQRSLKRDVAREQHKSLMSTVSWLRHHLVADYPEAVLQARQLAHGPSVEYWDDSNRDLAQSLILNHDLAAAREAASRLAADDPVRLQVPGLAALQSGDRAALDLLAQAVKLADAPIWDTSHDYLREPPALSLAIAKARFGDATGAQALLAPMPSDCYPCARARGVVAAIVGDRTAAEQWFAVAIKQAPGLPQAFVERGSASLPWGNVTGALTDAEHAVQLSPHYTDAWKLWGDALARQSQFKLALAKYDEALKYAPNWAALKDARDATVKRAN